jgi:hypothetical protein
VIGLRLAFKLLAVGTVLLRHGTGRRILAALGLAGGCAGLIWVLFAAPEPAAPSWIDQVTSAEAVLARSATDTPTPTTTTQPAPHPPGPPSVSPEQTARAWYARRHQLPLDRVRVLQADQIGADRVRVLVMVDRPGRRLDTAVITVTRHRGRWQVHP